MKRFLFLLFLAAGNPAIADLGPADVVDSQGRQITRVTWDAWCGEKRVKCRVKFTDGRLSVDDSAGILPEQVVSISLFRWCRQRAMFNNPNCQVTSSDKDYTVKYLDSKGKLRFATFTIHNWELGPSFYNDLGVWSGKATNWIPEDSLLGGKANPPDFKNKQGSHVNKRSRD